MAIQQPSPNIKDSSHFLISQDSATYRVTLTDVANNVADIIFNGGSTGNGGVIEIGDNFDVATDVYISKTNNEGKPSETAKFGAPNNFTDINTPNKYWMLQWVNGTVNGVHDDQNAQEGQFVLRDPETIFREVVDSIGGNITDKLDTINTRIDNLELNSLLDVQTRADGADDASTPLSSTAGDTFLMVADTTKGADGETIGRYKPTSFTKEVQDRIDDGSVTIELENLIDVNPEQPAGVLERLEINGNWYPGASASVPKYALGGAVEFDDILVYISDPSTQIDGTVATDTVAGWFYAEAKFGDSLNPAGISDDSVNAVGQEVQLGGVRILDYKNTELQEVDGITTIKTIPTTGGIPTNIKITADGVLYSEIPNTLTFRDVITIDDAELEKFSSIANAGPVPVADATTAGGPGNSATAGDPATAPSVGDFYVIQMTGTLSSKQLNWRHGDGSAGLGGSPGLGDDFTNGSAPIVEDGDIVSWGGEGWVVIGTVNTDTIAQDLQSVTTRGKHTTIGIELREAGLTSNDTVSSITLGSGVSASGTANMLSVGNIDFARFPTLS